MKVSIKNDDFTQWLKNQNKTKLLCLGILCIFILEIVALFMGYNGTLLKSVIALIAFGVGITIPVPKVFKNG